MGYQLTDQCIVPAKLLVTGTCGFSVDIQLLELFRHAHENGCRFCTMVFQYISLAKREWLAEYCPGRWIGRGPEAPVSWPRRSPDFILVDFYLCSSMKNAVYDETVTPEGNLGNTYSL